MKKVLIAIDYNPVSEKVAQEGYKLAKKLGAQVCLMHVVAEVGYYNTEYPTFMGYEGYGVATDVNLVADLRNIAEDFMETAARHLDDPSVEVFLGEGETAKSILNYAEEWSADLIVMGTHSHSKLEKIFLGTVASKVLEKTKIPIHFIPVKE